MTTLIVGRGLLGAAVERQLARSGEDVRGARVDWVNPRAALGTLVEAADEAARDDERWRLVWTAGAGVVATPAEAFEAEVALFERFVESLARPPGAMFLASSAGGLYAGSTGPPFTEAHEPRPLAPYGRAKLASEAAARRLAARGTRLAIARYANLYGPGQDLGKPQGLVSQLCLTHVTGKPLRIYVSTDTLRDYVYVDDAAAMATAMLTRVAAEPAGTVAVKILASGHAVTISGLVSASTRAFRRRPHVVHAVVSGTGQVRDLRFRSMVWTDLDALARTPLVVGLRATADDVERLHRLGVLSGALA